jgi:hypothetical protein
MRFGRGRLALGLAVLAGAGCTAGGTTATHAPPAPMPGTEACIYTIELYDWTVLDDSTLIVYAPVHQEPYLVKLFAPLFDLSFHQTLGFEGTEHNGQLCKGDYVLLRGEVSQRMSISAIRALTPDQAKQLIADWKQKSAGGAARQ